MSTTTVTLAIDGMTCASCAGRIEKRLNRIEGVHASVNFATERAAIEVPANVTPAELVAAVESTGYGASLKPVDHSAEESYLRRLVVSAALSLPVLMLSMVPALQFAGGTWLALALTTPVAGSRVVRRCTTGTANGRKAGWAASSGSAWSRGQSAELP